MYILDEIREENYLHNKARQLCEDYDYNPEQIGIAILRACGYIVKEHLKGEVSVKDPCGSLLYYG